MRSRTNADIVNNLGQPPVHPAISGEAILDGMPGIVSALAGMSARVPMRRPVTESAPPIENEEDQPFYSEPNIITPERSVNTIALRSKRRGSAIVMNDEPLEENGYIQIVHNSGTVIQIDQSGTVFISSQGAIAQATNSSSMERINEDKNVSVGRNWNVTINGGDGNMSIQGDFNIECENFNVMSRAKTIINSAEGIEMRGAKISMEAHIDNIDMAAKNIKMGSSETISLSSVESTYISAQSQLNLKSEEEAFLESGGEMHLLSGDKMFASGTQIHAKSGGEVFVEGTDTHMLSSGTLYATGSEVQVKGGTIYMDDIVRMAEGGASDATGADEARPSSPGVAPVTPTLRDVEPRRPREPRSLEEREPILMSDAYSTNYGVSPHAPDITDDGQVIPTTRSA